MVSKNGYALKRKKNALFDKRLADEEVWIRQGVKARRTRNEGRVRALKALRDERSERLNRQGNAKMAVSDTERSGKLVFDVQDLNFNLPDKNLVKNFNTTVIRGDRIALIGPNGCGKSTLIKLLIESYNRNRAKLKSALSSKSLISTNIAKP